MAKIQQLSWVVPLDEEQRRLDNFLITRLANMPKSALYRLIRQKKIRVDSQRAMPLQKLIAGQTVTARIQPPPPVAQKIKQNTMTLTILHQQEKWLVLNKPSKIAVHAGGKYSYGLIEAFRAQHNQPWELVHRLDKHTSGCLMLAKGMASLRHWHEMVRLRQGLDKYYLAIVYGQPTWDSLEIDAPLTRLTGTHALQIQIDHHGGKEALTKVWRLASWKSSYGAFSLVCLQLHTGRMHQIRVHLSSVGYPVVGDMRYGALSCDKVLAKAGIDGMALHAYALVTYPPATFERHTICCWPQEMHWQKLLQESGINPDETAQQLLRLFAKNK